MFNPIFLSSCINVLRGDESWNNCIRKKWLWKILAVWASSSLYQLYFEKLVSNDLKDLWNPVSFPLKKSHTTVRLIRPVSLWGLIVFHWRKDGSSYSKQGFIQKKILQQSDIKYNKNHYLIVTWNFNIYKTHMLQNNVLW